MNLIVSENLQEIVFSGRKFTILNRVRAAISLITWFSPWLGTTKMVG
jgi:hypothetical protein